MRHDRLMLRCLLPAFAVLAIALWAEPAGAQVNEVVVGVTPTCPYETRSRGCWAGAYWALGAARGRRSGRQGARTATTARRGST